MSDLITHQVTEQVLLAGQPQPADWENLAQRGYRGVINMRSDPERAAQQEATARAAGLDYLHLPLPAYELEREHLAQFHTALDHFGTAPLVIHCRSASRVALLWMLHRIVYAGWSQEAAEAELSAAGYATDSLETFRFCAEDFFERSSLLPTAQPSG